MAASSRSYSQRKSRRIVDMKRAKTQNGGQGIPRKIWRNTSNSFESNPFPYLASTLFL